MVTFHWQSKLDGPPPPAREAEMYKDLSKWSLLSVGKLCDAGITVIFTSGTVEAFLEGRVVLKGSVHRQQTNGLYMVDLNHEDEQGVSPSMFSRQAQSQLVAFSHGCFCSPSFPTFILILELGLKCLGISRKDTYKYLPISAATTAGYLDGRRFVSLPKHLLPDPPVDTGSKGEDQYESEPHPLTPLIWKRGTLSPLKGSLSSMMKNMETLWENTPRDSIIY
jgi:hypothetical protein